MTAQICVQISVVSGGVPPCSGKSILQSLMGQSLVLAFSLAVPSVPWPGLRWWPPPTRWVSNIPHMIFRNGRIFSSMLSTGILVLFHSGHASLLVEVSVHGSTLDRQAVKGYSCRTTNTSSNLCHSQLQIHSRGSRCWR